MTDEALPIEFRKAAALHTRVRRLPGGWFMVGLHAVGTLAVIIGVTA